MLKVIGAGFGGTGTHSLAKALELLGFGPCYHMLEVRKNPGHTHLWNEAIKGEYVDWDRLFSNYQSTVGWPAVAFLPQLFVKYSHAKVVLTTREPEFWYESAIISIFEALELSAQNPDPIRRKSSGMERRLILGEVFSAKYRDKDHAIKVYNQHIKFVMERVPRDQLLCFDVSEGWKPLCRFLGVPMSSELVSWWKKHSGFLSSEP